jgi:hypothetical protein
MKKITPKKLSKKEFPDAPVEDDVLDSDYESTSDPDTLQRKAAHEVCREFDLPDFIDQNDLD